MLQHVSTIPATQSHAMVRDMIILIMFIMFPIVFNDHDTSDTL